MQEATERLCHDLGEWAHILTRKDMAFDYDFRSMISVAQDLLAAKFAIERQQQVIDLLMKAVEPFADADDDDLDLMLIGSSITSEHLRRAREAKVEAERILSPREKTDD